MEGEENDLPPFWLQSSDSLGRAERRRRRLSRSSSLFFNSGAFLIILIVIALAFIFIIIPTILSFTSQIFKPNLVKKSWDSLNLFLVLFAIVCGFLSRNHGEDRSVSNSSSSFQETRKSNPSTPHRWYEFSDQTTESFNNGISRLRSSSSYPDLRQESSWVTRDERWRFYDDTHMSNYRPIGSDELHRRRPWQEPENEKQEEQEESQQNLEAKTIEVDTFQVRTEENHNPHNPEHPPPPQPSSPQPPPPSPPPPVPAPVTKRKAKRSYQAIGQKDETERNDVSEVKNVNSHPPPPPPRPPPPPPSSPPGYQESEPKSGKSEKKRSTKDLINSLRRKKKKQRQKSVENFESIIASIESPSLPSPYPPPSPPPPLPPPPSVFHDLFYSKKGKTKRPHSSFSQPPPPPPPPAFNSTVRVSKSKALSKPIPVTQKPPLPDKTSDFRIRLGDDSIAGNESPPIPIAVPSPIPPPPPPPPFKIQDWKFVRRGDFVRIKSSESERTGSPELDGGEESPIEGMSPLSAAVEGGQSPAPAMFCPSPDVDTKANNFIERFRAGLRLEKENSMRERDKGRSRFGPEPGLGWEH